MRLRARTLSAIALAALAVTTAITVSAASLSSRRVHGTFIQLTNAHREWPAAQWRQLFEHLTRLGISRLVVQWTVYDETPFFRPPDQPGTTPSPTSPVEIILRGADEARMKVLLGLAHDSRYWEKIQRDPQLVEVYLKRVRNRSEAAAKALAPLAQRHHSFLGWYLPEEIDDVNWIEPEPRRVLFEHVRDIAAALGTLTPGKPVALSGFSNARMDPQALEAFWTGLLETARVDTVLFQDGIGVGKLGFRYLPLYLQAIRNATAARRRELQVVVEVFQQVEGPPGSPNQFRAVPADLERIRRQVDLAARYSTSGDTGIMAFGIPEYMTPLGGADAAQLFRRYRELITTP